MFLFYFFCLWVGRQMFTGRILVVQTISSSWNTSPTFFFLSIFHIPCKIWGSWFNCIAVLFVSCWDISAILWVWLITHRERYVPRKPPIPDSSSRSKNTSWVGLIWFDMRANFHIVTDYAIRVCSVECSRGVESSWCKQSSENRTWGWGQNQST